MTTTSVKDFSTADIVTSNTVFELKATSTGSMFTKEKTNVFAVAGTSSAYEPSSFVTVPIVVLFIIIETFGNGFPFSSVYLASNCSVLRFYN